VNLVTRRRGGAILRGFRSVKQAQVIDLKGLIDLKPEKTGKKSQVAVLDGDSGIRLGSAGKWPEVHHFSRV
jgi:hypothetical protein